MKPKQSSIEKAAELLGFRLKFLSIPYTSVGIGDGKLIVYADKVRPARELAKQMKGYWFQYPVEVKRCGAPSPAQQTVPSSA